MANPSESRFNLYLTAMVLTLAALVGAGFFMLGDGGRDSGRNLQDGGDSGTRAVTDGVGERNRLRNPLVASENGGASGQNSKIDAYSEGEKKFLKDAIASFKSTLIQREKKRTTFLWDQKPGSGYT